MFILYLFLDADGRDGFCDRARIDVSDGGDSTGGAECSFTAICDGSADGCWSAARSIADGGGDSCGDLVRRNCF